MLSALVYAPCLTSLRTISLLVASCLNARAHRVQRRVSCTHGRAEAASEGRSRGAEAFLRAESTSLAGH
jgi:hypothetical protein